MGRFTGYVECPRCRANGKDNRGDNLATYADGGAHCFACGHHVHPRHYVRKEVKRADENKAVLPSDFTREVPATGWKWLLQYGLPYSYWKPITGYSPSEERLILTFGDPIRFSIGRFVGDSGANADEGGRGKGFRKWRLYGDGHGYVEILGDTSSDSTEVVLVEDIISAHKVAQVTPALCLFGTDLHTKAIQALIAFKRPVTLWLDEDQYGYLPKKIGRLMTFLGCPVRFIRSRKDPKSYSVSEIKEILCS